ncbi:sensor histidine kinase YkoH [Xylanibacillus composti]|uniref:histidine kinase n=1 Tax=Xylanibacillus composti TaxID=1572762 RepID=A0A8J4H4A4_9BACL|nr:sensor histidine kinase YkoH [Xylanibacillus composti]
MKTRLVLFSLIWMVGMIALFNLFVYFYFVRINVRSETELLWNRAQIVLRNPMVKDPANWDDPRLIEEALSSDSIVRIIGSDGRLRLQIQRDGELLAQHPVKYRTTYHTHISRDNGIRQLFIQVPIRQEGVQVGVLELGKRMRVLENYLSGLITALLLTTISAGIFAVFGSFLYSLLIFKPVGQLLSTMRHIQQSGSFERLGGSFATRKDEFGQLGRAFNQMIDRLEENDRKQRQFVADASHEWRTPLTVIESYAQLLERWGHEKEEIRKEAVQAILSETRRLRSLNQSLMKLAALDESAQIFRSIPLLPLAESVRQTLSRAFNREITLDWSSDRTTASGSGSKPAKSALPGIKRLHRGKQPSASGVRNEEPSESMNGPRVRGDEELLKQLLVILLDNAVKYSSAPVHIRLVEHDHHVVVCVEDKGIGIPEDELPHIFERFYRVEPSRNRATGGAGLGLAIAMQIIRLHGGDIDIKSRAAADRCPDARSGTRVCVTLPRG